MKNFIVKYEYPETTQDCINLINKEFGIFNWKRINKFKIKDNIFRIFKNENNDIVSLVDTTEDFNNIKLYNLNLSYCKQLSLDLDKICKNYYSHDYNEVYLNPLNNTLWVVAGDGGWGYCTLSKKEIKKLVEDDEFFENTIEQGDLGYIEINEYPETKIIKHVEYEAEYYPEDDSSYFKISQINDMYNVK